MFLLNYFQNCSSDGTGAILFNGYQMLHGTETSPFLHYPAVYCSRGKFSGINSSVWACL